MFPLSAFSRHMLVLKTLCSNSELVELARLLNFFISSSSSVTAADGVGRRATAATGRRGAGAATARGRCAGGVNTLTSLATGHSRIDALASSLSALEAPRDLIVIVRAAAGEWDKERADNPFARVNFGAAKDEMSEAVFGKASSGNSEDENIVLHVQRQQF